MTYLRKLLCITENELRHREKVGLTFTSKRNRNETKSDLLCKKLQSLYPNEVNLSLIPVRRLLNKAHNW